MKQGDDNGQVGIGSTKPYLIRALFEWCVDQGFTPYLSVSVDAYTQVPKAFVKDGQIVLNLSPEAVHQLSMGNDFITCSARFGGVAQPVTVPIGRVAALYARENGNGMAFEVEDHPGSDEPTPTLVPETGDSSVPRAERPKPGSRSHLKRIK